MDYINHSLPFPDINNYKLTVREAVSNVFHYHPASKYKGIPKQERFMKMYALMEDYHKNGYLTDESFEKVLKTVKERMKL